VLIETSGSNATHDKEKLDNFLESALSEGTWDFVEEGGGREGRKGREGRTRDRGMEGKRERGKEGRKEGRKERGEEVSGKEGKEGRREREEGEKSVTLFIQKRKL
jgi:hypothetical protein